MGDGMNEFNPQVAERLARLETECERLRKSKVESYLVFVVPLTLIFYLNSTYCILPHLVLSGLVLLFLHICYLPFTFSCRVWF
jgi:hypothetical protein